MDIEEYAKFSYLHSPEINTFESTKLKGVLWPVDPVSLPIEIDDPTGIFTNSKEIKVVNEVILNVCPKMPNWRVGMQTKRKRESNREITFCEFSREIKNMDDNLQIIAEMDPLMIEQLNKHYRPTQMNNGWSSPIYLR